MYSRNGKQGKLALVLAGGGMTGAVYEIGALRAIDDLLVDRSVNDFDIYVGTSAGAIVASFLANGVSPEEMYSAIAGEHPAVPPIGREHVFSFNQREILRRGMSLPAKLAQASYGYLRNRKGSTLVDALWSLTDALPSGLYDGSALERYMRLALAAYGSSNDFRRLERELFHHRDRPRYGRPRGICQRPEQRCADIRRRISVQRAADGLQTREHCRS
jgi:NTE family protein